MHAFPGDQPLILVEPAQIGQEDAEQLAELAFEGLDVPRLCLANAAQLALYADYAARQARMEGGAVEEMVKWGCLMWSAVTGAAHGEAGLWVPSLEDPHACVLILLAVKRRAPQRATRLAAR